MKDGLVMELCASEKKSAREVQDAFAEEIVPVEIPQRKGDPVVVDTERLLEGVVQPQPR
jgi:acetyl-CoA acetyltransferase